MTTLALMSRSADLGYVKPMIEAIAPHHDIAVWPDPRCLAAEVAVCWDPPRGVYAQMPALRLIHSIAAGVDNVIAEQDTRGLPVCRVVAPSLNEYMLQYVLWGVLYFHRGFGEALRQQATETWRRPVHGPAAQCRVGIMGLGELGGQIARTLASLGYAVAGWARTAREIPGVDVFAGAQTLPDFLARTDVLVVLLPLTDGTRRILDRKVFDALPAGAALVHCGRGEHLVADDLCEALARGHLRGAILDVFDQEPLAPGHPLWRTPGVVVTPHMAAVADFGEVVRQIVDNVARLEAGEPLVNRIDPARGY